jgi:hypothetical protein
MADHLGASLTVAALAMALSARRPPRGSLVHHSDSPRYEQRRRRASPVGAGGIMALSMPLNLSSFCLSHS